MIRDLGRRDHPIKVKKIERLATVFSETDASAKQIIGVPFDHTDAIFLTDQHETNMVVKSSGSMTLEDGFDGSACCAPDIFQSSVMFGATTAFEDSLLPGGPGGFGHARV